MYKISKHETKRSSRLYHNHIDCIISTTLHLYKSNHHVGSTHTVAILFAAPPVPTHRGGTERQVAEAKIVLQNQSAYDERRFSDARGCDR